MESPFADLAEKLLAQNPGANSIRVYDRHGQVHGGIVVHRPGRTVYYVETPKGVREVSRLQLRLLHARASLALWVRDKAADLLMGRRLDAPSDAIIARNRYHLSRSMLGVTHYYRIGRFVLIWGAKAASRREDARPARPPILARQLRRWAETMNEKRGAP